MPGGVQVCGAAVARARVAGGRWRATGGGELIGKIRVREANGGWKMATSIRTRGGEGARGPQGAA